MPCAGWIASCAKPATNCTPRWSKPCASGASWTRSAPTRRKGARCDSPPRQATSGRGRRLARYLPRALRFPRFAVVRLLRPRDARRNRRPRRQSGSPDSGGMAGDCPPFPGLGASARDASYPCTAGNDAARGCATATARRAGACATLFRDARPGLLRGPFYRAFLARHASGGATGRSPLRTFRRCAHRRQAQGRRVAPMRGGTLSRDAVAGR